ncbi:MAG: hypothetical protein AUI36_26000, partial [Cyanobacteria bacterium 13_1_40CM_2_61_4]
REHSMRTLNSVLALMAGLTLGVPATAFADSDRSLLQRAGIEHVLLISVDGLHALDVTRYVDSHPHSALAQLSRHGVTYSNANTPFNSDSFPGLLALVTGGSPVSHDVFYDVSYDRTLYDPANVTCSGPAGNTIVYDESIDLYVTDPATGLAVSRNVINPTRLPRGRDASGQCGPVFPHSLLKTNTIFEVVKAGGGRTAWADKHPAYDLVNGPSGKGVDDLYTPEITNVGGLDATVSVVCTVENDALKVKGILNEIHGKTHDGSASVGIPTVFGMNFQAVSVGQKLAADNATPNCNRADGDALRGLPGGYTDGSGTPTRVLGYGLDKTDAALGAMIDALQEAGIYESTLFVVSAKHGQSPLNPARVNKPGHFADLVATLPDAATDPAGIAIASAANCASGPCGLVQDDDVALVWLQDQSQTQAVADYLNKNAKALFIENVLAGPTLKLRLNDPALDSRTPDLFVEPQYGVIYTGSTKKNAEHGGISFGDTNVALMVS